MDPARMFKESLTSLPELENSQGQSRWSAPEPALQVHPQHRTCRSTAPTYAMGQKRK